MSNPPRELGSGPGLRAGTRFGPYQVEALLGRGGMGAVYRARHLETGRADALKVILASRLATDRGLARFRREVEVLARIEPHPGVVRVHACGLERGLPWAAMDLVAGRSLASILDADGPLPARRAAEVGAAVARALAHVHVHGVLHRDLKPENVLIADDDGAPRLVDFGLAFDAFAERLTQTGELLGTPAYMAPEQVSRGSRSGSEPGSRPGSVDVGGEIGPSTDVYGAGAVLYAALTGRPPFVGDSVALVIQVVQHAPTSPRAVVADVPAELEAICLRCLEKDPAFRYPSAVELAEDLDRWLRGEPVTARSSGIGRLLRRLRTPGAPRRRFVATLAAAGAFAIAALAVGLALGPAGIVGASPSETLAALERSLDAGDPLDPDDVAALATDPAFGGADELARRAELVAVLAAAVAPSGAAAPAEATIDRLVPLLRPRGVVDGAQKRRVERILAAAGRFDVLAGALHDGVPIASASPTVAAPLARAIVAAWEGGAPAPAAPDDDAAFGALIRAPDLAEPERGGLLLARASVVADAGDADRALDLFARAAARHGVAPPPDRVPTAVVERAGARLPELIRSGDDPRAAWAVGDILARATTGVATRLPIATIVELQTESMTTWLSVSGGVDSRWRSLIERPLREIAFLERFGAQPLASREMRTIGSSLGLERLESLADAELARPSRSRDPAVLLFVARLLLAAAKTFDADGAERAAAVGQRLVQAAATIGPDEAWLHLQVARRLEDLELWEDALEASGRALALDRELAPEQRVPAITETHLSVVSKLARAGRRSLERGERFALAVEAARVQLARRAPCRELLDGRGVEAWSDRRGDAISYVIREAAEAAAGRTYPACCGSAADAAGTLPGLDELIAMGVELGPSEAIGARLLRLRAEHHVRHERLEDAVEDFAASVRWELRRGDGDAGYYRGVHQWIAEILDERARLLRALGRLDEAARDDARVEASRAKVAELSRED